MKGAAVMPSPNFDFDVITGSSTPRRHPDKPKRPEPPASSMEHFSDFRRGEREMRDEIPDQFGGPAFSSTFRAWVRLLQALDYLLIQPPARPPCAIDSNPSHGDVPAASTRPLTRGLTF